MSSSEDAIAAQQRLISSSASSSTDDANSIRSEGSPLDQKPTLWQVNGGGTQQHMHITQLSPTSVSEATMLAVSGEQTTHSSASDLSGDAEGVWSADIDQAFQEALQIYPPCGRRKIILSDEGKMYGRNELIARYIKIRTGKTRTRKQVSSHIQVLARKKTREVQQKIKQASPPELPSKEKALQQLNQMSSAQIVSMKSPHAATGAAGFLPVLAYSGWPSPAFAATSPDLKAYHCLSTGAYEAGLAALAAPKLLSPLINPTVPLDDHVVASRKLTLRGFTAYMQPMADSLVGRVELVRIPKYSDEPLETIKLDDVREKYPAVLGDLWRRGPADAFFLAKCWANVGFSLVSDDLVSSQHYAVDSFYESSESFDISVSTKVCSFADCSVEKVEVYSPNFDKASSRHHFCLERSPMCDYMVKFITELKKLQGPALMNSVLDNFTVLQVVTNKATEETLMVIAFIFEISPEPEPTCRLYRLVS